MYHAEGYLELLPTLKKKEKHVKSVCRPSGQAITKEGRGTVLLLLQHINQAMHLHAVRAFYQYVTPLRAIF